MPSDPTSFSRDRTFRGDHGKITHGPRRAVSVAGQKIALRDLGLMHLPPVQRHELQAMAQARAAASGSFAYWAMAWLVFALGGPILLMYHFRPDIMLLNGLLLGQQVVAWGLFALMVAHKKRLLRDGMAAVLIDHGIRPTICQQCGYNLQGCKGEHCPECGCALASWEETRRGSRYRRRAFRPAHRAARRRWSKRQSRSRP